MASRAGQATVRLALFLVVSVLAGAVVAGLALPFVGGVGTAAKAAAVNFNNLPDTLAAPVLPQRSLIYTSDHKLLATVYSQNRVAVPLSAISLPMQHAIIALEDSRFYTHGAIDPTGVLRALVANLSGGGIVQGASTLTQQYVKNVLEDTAMTPAERQAAVAQSYSRKLREMRLAIGLEEHKTKNQILAGYLNIAYFGAGAYGVQAAAERYFSENASQLTTVQAATLAAIVQSPQYLDPLINPAANELRRNVALDKMLAQGYITQAAHDRAVATRVSATLRPSAPPGDCATSFAPYFCDYVLYTLTSDPAFGPTPAARLALLQTGGLTITTTLSSTDQAVADAAVEAHVPYTDPSDKVAALSTVQPGTGDIVAMTENRKWGISGAGYSTINFNVPAADGYFGGGSYGAQGGSTFKAFTLAAALDEGLPPSLAYYAPNRSPAQGYDGYIGCQGENLGSWVLQNTSSFEQGTFNMATGVAGSINTYFAQLERRTGVCRPVQIATALGVTQGNGKPLSEVPAFTLGAEEVTPLQMAAAYATFAAHGTYCAPRAILGLMDRFGRQMRVPPPHCTQALWPTVADGVAQLLAGVIDGPIPNRTGAAMSLGRPAAGKTGTTDDHSEVWFIGFVPQLATAVWVGDPRGAAGHPMTNIVINGQYFPVVNGASIPGPIWQQAMLGMVAPLAPQSFVYAGPPTLASGAVPATVPSVYGDSQAAGVAALSTAGVVVAGQPVPVGSGLPVGTVVGTSPPAGSVVAQGTGVTLFVSSGVVFGSSYPTTACPGGALFCAPAVTPTAPATTPPAGPGGGGGPTPTPTPTPTRTPTPTASASPSSSPSKSG